MRLIKVCLDPNKSFWFFKDISLTPKSRISDFFDLDELNRDDFQQVSLSVKKHYIKAFDQDGTQVFDLGKHNNLGGISTKCITEEVVISKDDLPEILSITCDEEEDKEELIISEEDIEEAKIILSKNGNTAKKIILSFSITKKNVGIIQACLELESGERQRKSIIKAAEEKLEELNA